MSVSESAFVSGCAGVLFSSSWGSLWLPFGFLRDNLVIQSLLKTLHCSVQGFGVSFGGPGFSMVLLWWVGGSLLWVFGNFTGPIWLPSRCSALRCTMQFFLIILAVSVHMTSLSVVVRVASVATL